MMRCWVSEASDAGHPVTPSVDFGGGGGWLKLVGFLLFDYWIVDASITHAGPLCPLPFGLAGVLVVCDVCSVVYRFVS